MASATWQSNPFVWCVYFKRAEGPLPDRAKERPILFSAPMVRALLEGRKSVTRRAVKGSPAGCFPMKGADNLPDGTFFVSRPDSDRVGSSGVSCPYGSPGDRLWVRETWAQVIRRPVSSEEAWWPGRQAWRGVGTRPTTPSRLNPEHHVVIYRADGGMPAGFPEPWRPSIFMPRWACRLVLEVTDVRVERLQDISEEDAKAEGVILDSEPDDWRNYVTCGSAETARESFQSLWSSIHG